MERSSLLQRASRRGLIPLLSVLLLFLLIPQASGIGVGASPDKIEFGVLSQRDGAMQELYVINTGGERARITLMVNGVNLIVDPQEFDLAAKESRAVNVSVDHTEAGEYAGSILITARPAGNGSGGLGFGAGVRIPVSFVLKGGGGYPKFMIAEGLLIGSMAAMLLWMRRVEG